MNKFEKLYDALFDDYGHKSINFCLVQVAFVAMGIRDVRLHDNTCNFISSDKFTDDEEFKVSSLLGVEFDSHSDAVRFYEGLGYCFGWANDPPTDGYRKVYSNRSGSSILMVNDEEKFMYSVAMSKS